MHKIEPDDFIIVDDASNLLASLDPKERRPQYGSNGLPKTCGSFTAEERAIAYDSFLPDLEKKKSGICAISSHISMNGWVFAGGVAALLGIGFMLGRAL